VNGTTYSGQHVANMVGAQKWAACSKKVGAHKVGSTQQKWTEVGSMQHHAGRSTQVGNIHHDGGSTSVGSMQHNSWNGTPLACVIGGGALAEVRQSIKVAQIFTINKLRKRGGPMVQTTSTMGNKLFASQTPKRSSPQSQQDKHVMQSMT
jgi:hypothetical protein